MAKRFQVLSSAILAVTLGLAGTSASIAGCSATDPGEIPYRAPAKTGRPTGNTGGSITAPSDAGANDDGAVFQTPFAPGAAKLSSTQAKHGLEAALQNQQNPAGHSCVNECHYTPGGAAAAKPYVAGGTVYTDNTGTTVVPAGVEVRIKNPDGTAVSAFTDENGNFFIRQGEFDIQQGAAVGVRDATNTMLMVSKLGAGATGGACANGNACHVKGGIGAPLRIKGP